MADPGKNNAFEDFFECSGNFSKIISYSPNRNRQLGLLAVHR